jgi:paraquat-inducible protein B
LKKSHGADSKSTINNQESKEDDWMDAKPHYFKIGLFVLIGVVLIVVAVVLFGAGLLNQNELYIESYFAESITGLSVGSPLEFRGVRIGQVEQIGFVGNTYDLKRDPGAAAKYSSYVRVVSAVLRTKLPDLDDRQIETVLSPMIERGLRVRITSNILTGQAFLEANYLDPNRFPVEQVPWTPKYPVIPTAPSELTTIKDSIDSILTELRGIDVQSLARSLDQLFASLNTVLSEAHLAELSLEAHRLLQDSRQKVEALEVEKINAAAQEFLAALNRAVADANVPQLSRQMRDVLAQADQKLAAVDAKKINADIERLLASLDRAVADANVPALSQEARGLMAELRTTNGHLQSLLAPPEGAARMPNVPEVVARLSQTISQLNKLLAAERPDVESVLANFREITDSLNELISTLKERPSELLFSSPPRKSEALQ